MDFRRRLMMAAQKVDLLEGYRVNKTATNNGYKLGVEWPTNDTVRFYHTSSGFMGPNRAAITFIGEKASYSTSAEAAMLKKEYALKTLEYGKQYKLTLTVLDVTKNTATTDNDGTFRVALGGSGANASSSTSINLSELVVGKQIEVVRLHSTSTPINCACFEASNSALLWDIKFKVKFEEVK